MIQMVGGAFSDAIPLMRSRFVLYVVMAAACAASGLLLPALFAGGGSWTAKPQYSFEPDVTDVILALPIFFVYPVIARTVRSEFRMTVGRFFGLIGIYLFVGIEIAFGLFGFFVLGFWMAVKWSVCNWTFLLNEGKNPFTESWDLTTGQFWETFGFMLVLAVAAGVPLMVGLVGVFGNDSNILQVAIILRPIAFLVYVYALHVFLLGQLRWMLRLRQRLLDAAV